MRPLIGVTTSEVRFAEQVEPTPQGEPPRREMALGLTYVRAIEAAGGLPVVLPPLSHEAICPLLAKLSGLCLSGGPDLDPETYDERPHAQLGPVEPDLDRFELAVARQADSTGLPILAICRGAQALNVARGGTLLQHLPEDAPDGEIDHRQSIPGDQIQHTVRVQPGSRLAQVTGAEELAVNSFHHQAAAKLGRGLRAVAWAPDGVIEAMEAPRRQSLLLAVQWHAEGLVDRPEHAALFGALVDASSGYAAGTPRARAA